MDKILHMIGMTNRAGRLEVGEEPAGTACREKRCRLLLVARDAADNSLRRVTHFAQAGQCLWVSVPYTKAELGSVTGRSVCAMAAVTEIGMAGAIAKLLTEQHGEAYAEIAEKLAVKAQRAQERREVQRFDEKKQTKKAKKPFVPTRIKRAQKEQQ